MEEQESSGRIPESVGEAAEKIVSSRAPFLDHLKKINDVYYDQIRIADQKAAYIFTFMLAFMISSAEGQRVFSLRRYSEGTWLQAGASAALACAVVVTVVSAILVVLPRHLRTAPTSLYWGAWQQKRGHFLQAYDADNPDYVRDEYLSNLDNLSQIARSKYRFVALAFRGLLATVLAYVLVLMAA
jgi:hypothetical protein